MKSKKSKPKDHEIIPTNSIARMERWHICQQIGVLFYQSDLSFDKLLQVKEFYEVRGIVDN